MSSPWEPYLAAFKRRALRAQGPGSPGPAPPRIILPYVALAFAPGSVLAGFLIGLLAVASRTGPVFYSFLFTASVAVVGGEILTGVLALAGLIECQRKGVPRGAFPRVCAVAALVFSAVIFLVSGLLAAAAVYIAAQVMSG